MIMLLPIYLLWNLKEIIHKKPSQSTKKKKKIHKQDSQQAIYKF